jgi:hypothetical protein
MKTKSSRENSLFPSRERMQRSARLGDEPLRCMERGPFSNDYEQLPEEGDDQERAAREWLRHVEAGRIGGH